jgi:hypothetical protein
MHCTDVPESNGMQWLTWLGVCRATLLVVVATFVALQCVEADLPVHCVHSQVRSPSPDPSEGLARSPATSPRGGAQVARAVAQCEGFFVALIFFRTALRGPVIQSFFSLRCWESGNSIGGLVSRKR